MDNWVLKTEDLLIQFMHDGKYHTAVNRIGYSVRRGRTLGIVGESGSGKSVSSLSIMGLLPQPPHCKVEGKVYFRPKPDQPPVDMLSLPEEALRQYRGRHVSIIFQEPMTSLNPVQKCGQQVAEMLRQHEPLHGKAARQRVLDLFEEVRLPRPEKIFDSYPHEISGGQKQRVMIAMARICHPALLIADEPTTALDVTVQKTILELLRSLQKKYDIGIIFITHDLGIVSEISDDVAVMYKGGIVEQGPTESVLRHPQHPYTQGLLACRPPLDRRPKRLPTVKEFLEGNMQPIPEERQEFVPSNPREPLISVRHLTVSYPLKKNLFGKAVETLNAVDDFSFDLYRGETLGLVGESGCGKSTLGRTLLQLLKHDSGTISYNGQSLDSLTRQEQQWLRRKIQIIFQDPYSSLNPRITIGNAICEPLTYHRIHSSQSQRRDHAVRLMQQVGLSPEWFFRYPHELSGGQRQRVCIARSLVLEPEVVICDESVSALDVSVQAQVLNLLNDLKEQHGYTYLFITHDLSVVKFLADRIMVMERGRLIEMGASHQVFDSPQQEYTRRLISAIPGNRNH